MEKTLCISIVLFLALLLSGCGKTEKPVKSGSKSKENPSGNTSPGFSMTIFGTETLWVEIADTPIERQRGLMFRKKMSENKGMLFIFETPQVLCFWMKNTYIPLDIAFVSADSTIVNILQMAPLNTEPRYYSNGIALYAIEANEGWFAKHGITTGQKVKIVRKLEPLMY